VRLCLRAPKSSLASRKAPELPKEGVAAGAFKVDCPEAGRAPPPIMPRGASACGGHPWPGCPRPKCAAARTAPSRVVRTCQPLSGSIRPKACRAVAGLCPPRWTSTGCSGVVRGRVSADLVSPSRPAPVRPPNGQDRSGTVRGGHLSGQDRTCIADRCQLSREPWQLPKLNVEGSNPFARSTNPLRVRELRARVRCKRTSCLREWRDRVAHVESVQRRNAHDIRSDYEHRFEPAAGAYVPRQFSYHAIRPPNGLNLMPTPATSSLLQSAAPR
jgi:hypothetical protein